MAISSATILRDYSLVDNPLFGRLNIAGSQVFSPIMNGLDFERKMVGVLVELAEKKGVKAAPLARAAWPEHKDAATKWRKIRNADPPQELSMRDAVDLANTLGISMAALCGIVEGRALDADLKQQAVGRAEKKEAPQTQGDCQDGPALPSGLERAGQGNGVDTLPGTRQPI